MNNKARAALLVKDATGPVNGLMEIISQQDNEIVKLKTKLDAARNLAYLIEEYEDVEALYTLRNLLEA